MNFLSIQEQFKKNTMLVNKSEEAIGLGRTYWGKILTLEQLKTNFYDLINYWVTKGGSKNTVYDEWVHKKFPKREASLSYTTRL